MYSVCMATYNGSSYLFRQIHSILDELNSTGENYEIIIVDDCSSDNTVDIIKSFNCENIFLLINETNIGHVKTFERAIRESTGKYIFLSDQDDLWVPGRVNVMTRALNKSKCEILFSGFSYIDEHDNRIFFNKKHMIQPPSDSRIENILKMFLGKADYWGCTSLITRESLSSILPFHKSIEAHDIWIAQVGLVNNSIHSINDITLKHRLHDNNVTPRKRRNLYKKIKSRFVLLMSFIYILK